MYYDSLKEYLGSICRDLVSSNWELGMLHREVSIAEKDRRRKAGETPSIWWRIQGANELLV